MFPEMSTHDNVFMAQASSQGKTLDVWEEYMEAVHIDLASGIAAHFKMLQPFQVLSST
jgi:hypothetical protein